MAPYKFFFNFSYWIFKESIVLGKLLAPWILSAFFYAKFGWLGISLYFSGIILGKISSNIISAQALNWISSREKQNKHQSVQGKESIWSNCYSFARRCEQALLPTHLFCWVACACMCVCICCSSWSVAGKLSWGKAGECWWWGGRTGRGRAGRG